MAIRNKNLANGVIIGTSATNVYTVPASLLRSTISQVRVINTGGAVATLNLWILQPGESAIDARKAIEDKTIGVGETVLLSEIIGETINSLGIIQATSDLTSSLSFSASGLEVSS